MITTPKTDKCIEMLGGAQLAFSPMFSNSQGYFDEESTIDFQKRIIAMFNYRLLPVATITVPENADKESARTNPVLQNIGDFESFWYVLKNYELVSTNDLKNEFWALCPDLGSMHQFLDVMNIKFRDVNYNYDTDIDKIKQQYTGLNELVQTGEIDEQKAEEICFNIHFLARKYNFAMVQIRGIYKEFREMANVTGRQVNTISANKINFGIAEAQLGELYGKLYNADYIDNATEEDFVNIHTGKNFSAKILWTKAPINRPNGDPNFQLLIQLYDSLGLFDKTHNQLPAELITLIREAYQNDFGNISQKQKNYKQKSTILHQEIASMVEEVKKG